MTSSAQMNAPAPSSLRLVLTLAIAGLISGIAIIGIYESTLPTITANKARELREAVFKVLPGVSEMQQLVYRDGNLVVTEERRKDEQAVYGGYDRDGDFVGYAIPAAGPGFQDTIGLLYGFAPQQKHVLGMEILESRETPGLGDKIYKDAEFVGSFSALSIEPNIVAVKKGAKARPNEIDAITGATISSKAVVRIINEAHAEWSKRLPPAGSEPPLRGTGPAGSGGSP
ncbi:MAG: FMN-binding protein [Gammaproteobacteria bacterium]|nr:FMN-binding protein [Gammaproteobacteria bacterium]NND46962.1 FMN-binding protein [Woeseiaceae bacterium]NNL44199.1 FMN-binding protein [Woeseiaceae bacterium]